MPSRILVQHPGSSVVDDLTCVFNWSKGRRIYMLGEIIIWWFSFIEINKPTGGEFELTPAPTTARVMRSNFRIVSES